MQGRHSATTLARLLERISWLFSIIAVTAIVCVAQIDRAALTGTVTDATGAVIQQAQKGRGYSPPWLLDLLKRKPAKLVAVALANKMARIAWKLMVSGERYNPARIAAPATPTREGAALRCVGLRAAPPRSASRLGAGGCQDQGVTSLA